MDSKECYNGKVNESELTHGYSHDHFQAIYFPKESPSAIETSRMAFALDGFTVFAPSLQSTFQLSLAVLVSYRFCGHI